MPVYDYVCGSCGHVVEVIHGISAPGPSACERCGGAMKRALSAPAIVFKGSGWAKKDARDAGRAKTKPAAGTTTAASTGEATSPSTGTEGAAPTGASGSGGATRAGDQPSTAASTTTTSGGSGTASG